MFNNPYPYMPQGPAYQRPAFQQAQMYPQQMQQPMMQESGLQARFVSGKEEAMAANVMPGMPCCFLDRANGMAYYKAIDPVTGAVEFRTMKEVQPEQQAAPQYATLEMLQAMQTDIDQRFAALMQKTSRKAVNTNDE